MSLMKTSILNAISVAVRMLSMLILNKILAVYAGPAGYAVIGQFQNAIQIFMAVTGGVVSNGVTKYTAQYEAESDRLKPLWRTATKLSVVSSLVCACVIVPFAAELSVYFLQSAEYSNLFRLLAITLVLFSLNTTLMAVINGKSEVVLYLQSSVIGSLVSVSVVGGLTYLYGFYGALIALTFHQSITFVATLLLVRRTSWFKLADFWGKIDQATLRNLAGFALMAITSAICLPLTQILIRDLLGNAFSWDSAGIWEGMNKLSSTYLLFVTSVLSLYYLPKLSKLTHATDIKNEILSAYKLILPVVIAISVFVFFIREFVVVLLFSEDFLPMQDLFFWQLTGDVLKIGSWLVGFVMISQAMVKRYIVTELLFSVSLYLCTVFLTPVFGLEGAVIAYALNYGLYWIVVTLIVFGAVKR